jgi:hypothetical protein
MPDRTPPKLDNAPGYVLRPIKDGWAVKWFARTDIIARGYKRRSYPVCHIGLEPTAVEKQYISEVCNAWQDDMLAYAKGIPHMPGMFDGTWKSLAHCYTNDPDSPFHKNRYRSRRNAKSFLNIIVADHGDELVADTKARHFLRWYEAWSLRGIPMAHGLMGYVRSLCTFGKTILDRDDCAKAKELLRDMKFTQGKPRKSILLIEQAIAVREELHRRGKPEIALAQALQFELTLRQKDVIGEWIPQGEPGISDVIRGNNKWLHGLRWEEIDEDLVVRHTTSKRGKDLPDPDLKHAPMVIEELERIAPGFMVRDITGWVIAVRRELLPAKGPMIVNRTTGFPWDDNEFRKEWRRAATAVGIPKTTYNMDTRAGAITEALGAGANLEDVRKTATHSQSTTTQRYSRGDVSAAERVMIARVASRNKPGK